jgi:uncharacterized membrane protein YeiH
MSSLMMIAVVGEHSIVAEFSKKSVYIFASVIAVVGFVMQDVVADTMSTEVIDKSQSKEEIHQELASIQVLARLSLGFAIFITGWIGGELADVFKDEREVVFMIALFIKISTLSTNEPKIIFTVHGTVSHMPNSAKSAALISSVSFTQKSAMLNISLSPTKALAVVLSVLLTPIRALRLRYVPLLLVYFAYGSSVFTAIALNFWVKETLDMSAADLAELGIWNINTLFRKLRNN